MTGDVDVKQLLLQVDASVELLRRNLGAAEKRVAGFEQSVKASTAKTDAAFGKLGTGLVGIKGHLDTVRTAMAGTFATAAVAAIGTAIKSALDYASSLGETAQQLGVTTKELQEYRYAASQVGIEQEEMDKALAKLTRTMGEAESGGKKQAAVFESLGIKLRDSNGHMKTAGEVIPGIAKAMEGIPDPAKRAAIEVDLFGKTGQKLDTLLAGGAASVNNLRNAAHELGIVLSDKDIQSADDAADKLAAVKQVLEAKLAAVVAENSGAIIEMANALGELVKQVVDLMRALKEFRASGLGQFLGAINQGARGILTGDAGAVLGAGQKILTQATGGAANGAAAPTAYTGIGKPAATGVSGKIDPAMFLAPGKFGKANLAPEGGGLVAQFGVGARDLGLIDPVDARTAENIRVETAAIQEETYQTQRDALRDQYDLTDSTSERRKLALQMVDLEYDYRQSVLDGIIANDEATTADRERARIARAALGDRRAADEQRVRNDNAGPGLAYLKDLRTEATHLGEAFEGVAVRGLQNLDRSLADSAKSALGLHGVLGDIVGDLIEIAIRKAVIGPLADALFGGMTGGVGGLLGGLFGGFRAGGGPVSAGTAYVVGEKRPELFVPNVPGRIVPNVPAAANDSGSGMALNLTINAPGATAETVQMIRRELASAAPMLVQAATANTTRQMNRRRL